jgi:uncharacterized damage-inducible protein DinB
MKTNTPILGALLALSITGPLNAQELQNTVTGDLEDLERKFVGLAEAIPQDSYSWRPMEGVRSVSEVLMHIVAANYAILLRVGAALPEGPPEAWLADPDSFTNQVVVVEALRQSFQFARDVIGRTPNDGLWIQQAPQADPGTTVGSQLILLQYHAHEHLGQMIAYARVNGIVPPWSG